MSDASVATALRSSKRLVVVEAPAGCGKTFQGATYASEIAERIEGGRVLILAHTHAACDVFASRTRGASRRVDIRTIDSLIGEIVAAYHSSFGIPADTGAWARRQTDGYAQLAAKAAALLRAYPMIAKSLAQRYPVIICDEHQDASADQHAIAMACHEEGALVRIFGDPMQRIYGGRKKAGEIVADHQRWESLKQNADAFDELDEPHRWPCEARPLGRWILEARAALHSGGQVDLRATLPAAVSVIVAENQSPKYGGYRLGAGEGKPIYALVKAAQTLLVLSAHNKTVDALRACFGRRLPIWEGHLRDRLAALIDVVQEHNGDAASVAKAAVGFVSAVATGFSPSACSNALLDEVSNGCVAKRRGKTATLQTLARIILDEPDHRGVAKMLQRLHELITTDPAFGTVRIDYHREFWDAVGVGQFDDIDHAYAEISRRRIYSRPLPPAKAISTVHKAKGLECGDVLIMPCDDQHFGDNAAARCLFYVAMSRAMRSLTIVVSRQKRSPLVIL